MYAKFFLVYFFLKNSKIIILILYLFLFKL